MTPIESNSPLFAGLQILLEPHTMSSILLFPFLQENGTTHRLKENPSEDAWQSVPAVCQGKVRKRFYWYHFISS